MRSFVSITLRAASWASAAVPLLAVMTAGCEVVNLPSEILRCIPGTLSSRFSLASTDGCGDEPCDLSVPLAAGATRSLVVHVDTNQEGLLEGVWTSDDSVLVAEAFDLDTPPDDCGFVEVEGSVRAVGAGRANVEVDLELDKTKRLALEVRDIATVETYVASYPASNLEPEPIDSIKARVGDRSSVVSVAAFDDGGEALMIGLPHWTVDDPAVVSISSSDTPSSRDAWAVPLRIAGAGTTTVSVTLGDVTHDIEVTVTVPRPADG